MLKLTALKHYFDQQVPGLAEDHRPLMAALYLADWKHAIDHGAPITQVDWAFHGTTLAAVNAATEDHGDIQTEGLSDTERAAADHVVATMAGKHLSAFHRLVISTWPAITQPAGQALDLSRLAREYRAHQAARDTQATAQT